MITLGRASARKARALYGIVIPRDTAWVRAMVGLVNWFLRRVLRWQFRASPIRIGRSTVCVPWKGSTWIGQTTGHPACGRKFQ